MSQGFFSKKETESISAIGGKIHSCVSCGMYKHCMSPKMSPSGEGKKDIMIIGESPSQRDDERGKHWQGKDGRMLRRAFDKLGIDLQEDCISLNAVNCSPDKPRAPSIDEINHCRSIIVWKAIEKYMPKVIILLGDAALKSIIGHRWNGSMGITKWRGFAIPDQQLKSWVCPTYHPDYLMYKEKPVDMMRIWMNDLEQAIQKAEEKFPRFKTPEIRMTSNLGFLKEMQDHNLAAFDYETTAIKPHAKGQRIVSCAIAPSEDLVYAFKIPKTRKGRYPLRKWLHNKRIPKIAHNMKYEDQWGKEILKVTTQGWAWDTMLAAHVLDNRPGVKGLKFQMYVHFGVLGYEEEVEPYMRSPDELGDNAMNKMLQLMKTVSGTKKVLKYNALDSVYEYRLALKQMDQLGWDPLPF